jgi:hypothetical protein
VERIGLRRSSPFGEAFSPDLRRHLASKTLSTPVVRRPQALSPDFNRQEA